mmetsp:Transcript_55434/g.104079  ORF Transcript_55434/g.104079 Transcript_55434/m.104079 type:complete len:211 (-) Transcript_55434:448-1080(-)
MSSAKNTPGPSTTRLKVSWRGNTSLILVTSATLPPRITSASPMLNLATGFDLSSWATSGSSTAQSCFLVKKGCPAVAFTTLVFPSVSFTERQRMLLLDPFFTSRTLFTFNLPWLKERIRSPSFTSLILFLVRSANVIMVSPSKQSTIEVPATATPTPAPAPPATINPRNAIPRNVPTTRVATKAPAVSNHAIAFGAMTGALLSRSPVGLA